MEHDLGYDLDEAFKRENISIKDIDSLRTAVEKFAPKSITNKQLALFLHACGSVEDASKTIKIYFEARKDAPEHFSKRNPGSDEIQQCLNNQDYFHLPPTPEGRPVIFHRVSNSKPSNYNFDSAIKTFFMTIDACLYQQGPRPGVIFLFDMSEVRFGHLTRVRIGGIKKFFHYLQDALPAKLCQIHILNVVTFFDKILSLIRPFMRAEIFKVLYTYPPNVDLNEFHTKWVPKECLPQEFGGTLPPMAELHAKFRIELESITNYYKAEENQRNELIKQSNNDDNVKETRNKFQGLDID